MCWLNLEFTSRWTSKRTKQKRQCIVGLSNGSPAGGNREITFNVPRSQGDEVRLPEIVESALVVSDGVAPLEPEKMTGVKEDHVGSSATQGPRKRSRSSTDTTVPEDAPEELTDFMNRTIIEVQDMNFNTLHNLLYFLYTGYVNLHYPSPNDYSAQFKVPGYPEPVEPFEMYRAADMYLVAPLVERCLLYMLDSDNISNNVARAFDIASEPYEDLREGLVTYLAKRYDEVKGTREWKEAILAMNDSPPEELKYQTKILLQITNRLRGELVFSLSDGAD